VRKAPAVAITPRGAGLLTQFACIHDNLDNAIGLVIFLNAVVIGLETEFGSNPFLWLEHFFFSVYFFEMVVKVDAHGLRHYLLNHPFDAFLLSSAFLDLYLSKILPIGNNLSALRLLRTMRVIRLLRLFKLFRELQIIIDAFLQAFKIVMWIGTLIIITNYVFAVFFTQLVGHKAELWGEKEAMIKHWCGSLPNAMVSLFVVMTLDDWIEMADTIAEVMPPLIVYPVFMFYILLSSYTMTSLITGIISETLITRERDDEEHKAHMLREVLVEATTRVRQIVTSFDQDGSGDLTVQEVEHALSLPGIHDAFIIELKKANVHFDAKQLINFLAHHTDENGAVAIDAITDAIVGLEGEAKAVALFEVRADVHRLQDRLNGMDGLLTNRSAQVNQRIANVESTQQQIIRDLGFLRQELRQMSASGHRAVRAS
jgi:hypothetical protein